MSLLCYAFCLLNERTAGRACAGTLEGEGVLNTAHIVVFDDPPKTGLDQVVLGNASLNPGNDIRMVLVMTRVVEADGAGLGRPAIQLENARHQLQARIRGYVFDRVQPRLLTHLVEHEIALRSSMQDQTVLAPGQPPRCICMKQQQQFLFLFLSFLRKSEIVPQVRSQPRGGHGTV